MDTGKLEIIVRGMPSTKGQAVVAIFNNKKDFLENDYRHKYVKIPESLNFKVTFENLPVGDYAISIIHDENKNEVLDTRMFGIPKEAYGFSNNAKGVMGPPSFEDAKVSVSEGVTTTTIQIGKYDPEKDKN